MPHTKSGNELELPVQVRELEIWQIVDPKQIPAGTQVANALCWWVQRQAAGPGTLLPRQHVDNAVHIGVERAHIVAFVVAVGHRSCELSCTFHHEGRAPGTS